MAKKDAFASLSFLKWDTMVLPCTKFSSGFGHDIARHKYYRRDGQNLEETGREGFEFTFTIPFIKGLRQAKGEKWSVTPLYPQGLQAFVDLCQDGATKVLVHPELGVYRCKPARIHWDTMAEHRGGVYLDVTWLEDNTEDEGIFNITFDSAGNAVSPAIDVDKAAEELAILRAQRVKVPELPKKPYTLTSLARDIVASRDRIGRFSQERVGVIDRAVRDVRDIGNAISTTPSALAWPARQGAIRMENALVNARADLSRLDRSVLKYRTAKSMTVSNIARVLGIAVQSIVELNPNLLSSPIVPAETVVRYHPK
jgi:hypothetical protein